MSAPFRIMGCIALGMLGAALATAALVAPPRDTELGGVYDDEGTVAVPPPGETPALVSLHALLSGQFTPALARLIHEDTGQIRLKHTAGLLEAEVTNRDGEATWTFTWKQGEDYAMREGRVLLLFKGARVNDDQYLLILETVSAYKLLQVEVQRLTPTVLGRRMQPMGTYLFSRAE